MNKRTIKLSKHILAALSILTFTFFCIASGSDSPSSTTELEKTTKNDATGKVENWSYSEQEDKMEGIKQYYASNTSTNEIEFEFPYSGGSTFDIIVRNNGKENEVLLTVSKGQFMMSIDGSERIKVKFDDEKPETYSYNSSADASSDVIFLNNSSKFLKKLKTAKKVMIETTFFDAGNKVIEFNVEGLKWDK